MKASDLGELITRQDLEHFYDRLIHDLSKILADSQNHKEFYSPKEFSDLTGLKYSTVIHYCNTGRLKARQDRPKGAWTIPASEMERYTDEADNNIL